jgi:preprotein translocase subunit SecA
MAIEGAELEAEEKGEALNIRTLIQTIEQTAGLRIQLDNKENESDFTDSERLRKMTPELIEASLGLRVWSGMVQAVERRIGEKLSLDQSLSVPIDWDKAEKALIEAFESSWTDRSDRIESEIVRQITSAIADRAIDDKLKLRLIIQMAYGQRTFFDRKTHQRKAVSVARFSYAHSVANMISHMEKQDLEASIIDHLMGAQAAIHILLGQGELAKSTVKSLDDFDLNVQTGILAILGEEFFSRISPNENFHSLSVSDQEQLAQAIGQVLFTEVSRTLFLSVGDGLWVEYLTQIEALRTSIGLEAYGQRDPLVQYKSKAFDMFQQLLTDVRAGMVSRLFRMQVSAPAASSPSAPKRAEQQSQPGSKSPKKRKRKRRRKRK